MQKINRKWIAILLVISLLTSFPVYAADADTEIPVETEAVRVSEVESLRETNSETYLMSDGTYQCVVYAEDKYYLDSNDTLQRIDNTIVLETASAEASLNAASVARYKNTANAFDVRFSGSGVPEISMAKDGGSVTFSPLTAAKGNTLQMNAAATPITVGAVNDCAALGQLTPTGSNTVTYKNAFANTDLVYVLENGALKEYIILRNSNAAGEFSFLFTLDGLTLETVDDNAYLTDSDGNAVFALSDLFAIDANGVLTEALSYSFTPVKGDDQIIVTVTLDESYLQAADRTFPVIIDPSITISSVQTADACVCSYYPNTNYKTAYQLRTGKDTDYGIRRSYIKFTLPESVLTSKLITATLNIEKVSGVAPTIRAYMVTGAWDSGTITWNNQPWYASTYYSTQAGLQSNGTWYNMYVTSIVNEWILGRRANYGFAIIDSNESNTDHWTTFYSSDASSPHKPELIINYEIRDAALLAYNEYVSVDPEENRNYYFELTEPYLEEYKAGNVYTQYYTSINKDNMISRMMSSSFLAVHTHGKQNGILIAENTYLTSADLVNANLSRVECVLLLACKTGQGGYSASRVASNNPINFLERIIVCGAESAIGFNNNIYVKDGNLFAEQFARLTMEDGWPIEDAVYKINTNFFRDPFMLELVEIGGNKQLVLN